MKTLETPVDPAAVDQEQETVDVWLPDAPTPRELITPVVPVVLPELPTVEVRPPYLPESEALTRPDLPALDELDQKAPTIVDLGVVGGSDHDALTIVDLGAVDGPDPNAATALDLDAATALGLDAVGDPGGSTTDASVDAETSELGASTAEALSDAGTVERGAPTADAPIALPVADRASSNDLASLGRGQTKEKAAWAGSELERDAETDGPLAALHRRRVATNPAPPPSGAFSSTEDFDGGATGLLPLDGGHGTSDVSPPARLREGARASLIAALRVRPLRWGAVGVFALVSFLATQLWIGGGRDAEPARDLTEDGAQARALEAFERGVELVHQRDWRGASRRFAEAAALDPSNPEPTASLERVGREEGFAARAARAERCLERGDLDCTRAELQEIAPDSLVFEDLAVKLLPALEELEEAGGLVHGDGSGSATTSEASAAAPPRQAAGASAPVGGARATALPQAEASRLLPRRPAVPARAAPSSSGTVSSTERRSSSLRTASPRTGASEADALDAPAATPEVDPAEEARRHIQAGARARSSGNLEMAAWHLEQALTAAPEDPLVLKELDDLRALLPGLFREAYASRVTDSEGAMQKLRLVVRLSAPGSDLRTKAEKWLGRLEDQP